MPRFSAGAEEERISGEITGLNLFIPGADTEQVPATTLDVAVLPGGEWWLRQRVRDMQTVLESRRLPAAAFDAATVRRLIAAGWPQAGEIRIGTFPELTEKLGYPALKAEFLYDIYQFTAALVFTEEWSFWFVLQAPSGNRKTLKHEMDARLFSMDSASVRQSMEELLLGITAVEPENGDFLPGSGPRVLVPDGTAAADNPTLMDALIRVKKTVDPEEDHDDGEGQPAYRYDGTGEAAGLPALLLSFDSDSPEKFTAERRFAVDGAGAVYETDADEGTEYRRVDEGAPVPLWTGKFLNGDILLDIGMQPREGMYYREDYTRIFNLGVLFTDAEWPLRETIENKEVLAEVEGRNASGGGLIFTLDSDDSAITVSVESRENATPEQLRLAGRYVLSNRYDGKFLYIPLVNKLGFGIQFVRIDASTALAPIATDLADGGTVNLGSMMLMALWNGSRLVVRSAEDESGEPWQFSGDAVPANADSLALAIRNGVPVLQCFEKGYSIGEVPAGLPIKTLLSAMEKGLEPDEYAELMAPHSENGRESSPSFAVTADGESWRLLFPGAVFQEDADGTERLSIISFGRNSRRIDLHWSGDVAYDGIWHAATTTEDGLAERYVLNIDGTFVHAVSDSDSDESEDDLELFSSGTWTVEDGELRLDVEERWILPAGGVEDIVPDDALVVVDGEVIKRMYDPPESEIHSIARADADPETGRDAITIGGTTFYKFSLAAVPALGVDFSTLPPKVQAQRYLAELAEAGKSGDNAKVVEICERMLALPGVTVDSDIRFHYAKSLATLGRNQQAERELAAFLNDPNADSGLIDQALAPVREMESFLTLDCGSGVTLKFAKIPAGTFMMGSPASEPERGGDEVQHQVTLTRPFYMGVYEVTQAQYEAVMGTNPSNFQGASNPVEQVSWNDAMEFCRRLSSKTGRKVRLPTEAEWEYACRAGTTTPFNTGVTISTDQANYDGDSTYGSGSKGVYREETISVGSFSPNAWGLYDMHGNIYEWCSDWYGEYSRQSNTNPQGASSGERRVPRGGSWYDNPRFCRSAYRYDLEPDFRDDDLGFRVALD